MHNNWLGSLGLGFRVSGLGFTTVGIYRDYLRDPFLHSLLKTPLRGIAVVALRVTWTLKVCKIMAFMAVIMGLGLLCYILLGSR